MSFKGLLRVPAPELLKRVDAVARELEVFEAQLEAHGKAQASLQAFVARNNVTSLRETVFQLAVKEGWKS